MELAVKSGLRCLILLSLFLGIHGVSCPYCGKEYVVLGRHLWRCPSRGTATTPVENNRPMLSEFPSTSSRMSAPPLAPPTGIPSSSPHGHRRRSRSSTRRSRSRARGPQTAAAQATNSVTTENPSPPSLATGSHRNSSPTHSSSYSPPAASSAAAHDATQKPIDWITCHCGRKCKGRRGLRAHQRRCRTIDALVGIDPNINRAVFNGEVLHVNTNNDNITDSISQGVRPVLSLQPVKGLRLPRSKEAWKEAHPTS